MIGIKHCDKCGFRHGGGHCCIDIYQQLGHAEGPSVARKVLLAFVVPLLVFTGSLILTSGLLSAWLAEGSTKSFITFLIALAVTAACVQLIRVLTRKEIETKDSVQKSKAGQFSKGQEK